MDFHYYDFLENDKALLHMLLEDVDNMATHGIEGAYKKFKLFIEEKVEPSSCFGTRKTILKHTFY